MKKLSIVTLAVSGLLFVSVTAGAQNGSRNMQRRNQPTQDVPYDQGNTVYNNGNRDAQHNGYSTPYNRGDEQYGNRNGSYERNDRRHNERHNGDYNRRDRRNYNSYENNTRMKHGRRHNNCY